MNTSVQTKEGAHSLLMQSQINSRILQNKRTSITVQPSLQFLSAATQQNSRPNSNTPLTP